MDKPIWKSIAEDIEADILRGAYLPGAILPSERELSGRLGVARGTVKAAYHYLVEKGLAIVSIGNGTMVTWNHEQLSDADALSAELESIRRIFDSSNLTIQERQQIIEQEIWRRVPIEQRPTIAFVECNPEILYNTVAQIREVCGLETYAFLLTDVLASPVRIASAADMIALPAGHLFEIKKALPYFPHIKPVGMDISTNTLNLLAKIPQASEIVLLYQSDRFLSLQNRYLDRLGLFQPRRPCRLDVEFSSLIRKLKDVGGVVLPQYSRSPQIDMLERACREKGIVFIPFDFMLDKGSLFKLEEDAKQLWMSRHSKRSAEF